MEFHDRRKGRFVSSCLDDGSKYFSPYAKEVASVMQYRAGHSYKSLKSLLKDKNIQFFQRRFDLDR